MNVHVKIVWNVEYLNLVSRSSAEGQVQVGEMCEKWKCPTFDDQTLCLAPQQGQVDNFIYIYVAG